VRWSVERNDLMTIKQMEISFPGGQKVDALYGGFVIKTDQPVEDGGGSSAPPPFSLFLASLGTCAAYYVLAFCQRNDISPKNIKITAYIDRNDMTHMVEEYKIGIQLPKEFPPKYKNAIVKSAESCIVKKHFEKPPHFTISVVEP
jgi:putative redox protein